MAHPTPGSRKVFIPLENNPQVMTKLAHNLGLASRLSFYDLYSLDDPDLLALVPRPALALLFVYPMTDASEAYITASSANMASYTGKGLGEPVLFYHQIITHACGLIGLLHCVTNGHARSQIRSDSPLSKLVADVAPLSMQQRAQYLHDSDVLETLHDAAAHEGSSEVPERGDCPPQAFIAFVKGTDGHLYELEGRREGPIDLGQLEDDEDVLSARAINLGPIQYVKRGEESGSTMFSCTVLA